MELTDSVKNIKGIGDKTADKFARLGISTVQDLIYYYPRAYKTYSEPVPVKTTVEGDRVAVFCKVVTYVESHNGKRYNITSLSAADDSGSIRMVWFNMPFLKNKFHKGEEYVFYGVVKYTGNMRVMEMPEYFTLTTETESTATYGNEEKPDDPCPVLAVEDAIIRLTFSQRPDWAAAVWMDGWENLDVDENGCTETSMEGHRAQPGLEAKSGPVDPATGRPE
jgi:RecG-like helicase